MKTIKKLFMNRIIFAIVTLLSVGFALASCNKDTSEEEILKSQLATADSLLKRGGVIKYTVKIVSTANSSILKSKMSIENANVTIYQNDKVYTAITDANGFAIFPDMRIGTAAVNVKLKDHAEVDYVADLTPADNLINLSQGQMVNTVRYASTMVPMFPIADPGCATITGKVTAELDLTNTTPEPAPGVKVTATVDIDDPDFVARYIAPTQGTTSSPSAGRILKYAFSDASVTATTAVDGMYTLNVPSSINGLPIKLSISDYQTTQKLYLENDPESGELDPGEHNMPVLFTNDAAPTAIPEVKPLYILVDEPTVPIGLVTKNAKLTFELDANGGVSKVNVIEKGKYSTKPAIVVVDFPTGTGAILEPVYNQTTGEIDNVTIVKPGSGYTTLSYTIKLLTNKKQAKIDAAVDDNGNISSVTIRDKGYGYITKPNIKFLSPAKNHVEPEIVLTMNYWLSTLGDIQILIPGRLYNNITNYPTNSINSTFSTDKSKFILSTGTIVVKNIYLGTGNR